MHRNCEIKYMVFSIHNIRNLFNFNKKNDAKILCIILFRHFINNDSIVFIRVKFAKKYRP